VTSHLSVIPESPVHAGGVRPRRGHVPAADVIHPRLLQCQGHQRPHPRVRAGRVPGRRVRERHCGNQYCGRHGN